MSGKKFVKVSVSVTLVLLIAVAALQIAVDPLFQYHLPWFGLKADVFNERYQNPGVAKQFDYDNVIMGNSMSENFLISDAEDTFGGTTVKLTLSGFGAYEWTKILDIIQQSDKKPKNIMFNIDPYVFENASDELNNELPDYLYDNNVLNDANYLWNFTALRSFTSVFLKNNLQHNVHDYNSVFVWGKDMPHGRDITLNNYQRPEKSKSIPDSKQYVQDADKVIGYLMPYIDSMKDTNFVFFYSPFSMLYWDGQNRQNAIEARKASYIAACEKLISCSNVDVYCWADDEMLNIMSNLDNYRDEAHYSADISKIILARIKDREGLLSKSSYRQFFDELFDWMKHYDFDALFCA